MKKLTIALCLTLLLLTFSQIASAQVYTSQKDSFSVWFPGKPKYETSKSASGTVSRIYTHSVGTVAMIIMVGDMPGTFDSEEAIDAMYDMTRDITIANQKAKLISEKKVKHKGYLGRELKISKPSPIGNLLLTDRMYIIGDKLYQELTATPIKRPQTTMINKFLNSFEYLGDPAPETTEPAESEKED